MERAALLDVDGTLVDANYQHALAWYRAFREHDITLPVWRIHRAVGMGGDRLVAALAGDEVEGEKGDDIRAERKKLYDDLIEEVAPFAGAQELITDLLDRNVVVILASSAEADELDHYLDLLEARTLVDAWTSKDDVEDGKPGPDLVQAALAKVNHAQAVMVGDTRWDVEAAAKADVPAVCVLTGGWSREELVQAGAVAVYESVDELRRKLDESPFA